MTSPYLPPEFYQKPTSQVARALLGTFLVCQTEEGTTIGRIVETEAYLADDPACHASRGQTPRTKIMFGPPGRSYVYFIYGMYYCFNVVTAPEGIGEAVLIRALEPVQGLDLMEARRRRKTGTLKPFPRTSLCSGPAKLVIAMGITPAMNGQDLFGKSLHLLPADSFGKEYSPPSQRSIIRTTRIGISLAQELPLRFYIKGNPYISRK